MSEPCPTGCVLHTAMEKPPEDCLQQLDLGMDIHVRVLPVREAPALHVLCGHGLMANRDSSKCMETDAIPSVMHHTFPHHDTTDSMCC